MIDLESLRNELIQESLGAFFVDGFGGALFEVSDIEKASTEMLINIAKQQGRVDIKKVAE